eukprot:CAMPEP_0196182290 /NCGR_PEP_ID=MMETSP0911-20130528/29107_1 /TAXON_ID=49265 /ORGANISM="Thalassiosira rotula, Strain GSO102" /LENGTH=63 /DNA_ID=CAMNT_0041451961 /DNA_START=462 /DNA_END=653 /DNA_ORIENTATION=+
MTEAQQMRAEIERIEQSLAAVGEVEPKTASEGSLYTNRLSPEQQEVERFVFDEVEEEAALTVE